MWRLRGCVFQMDVTASARAQRWECLLCAQNQSEQGEERT